MGNLRRILALFVDDGPKIDDLFHEVLSGLILDIYWAPIFDFV